MVVIFEINSRITIIRNELGLSRQAFGEAVGVSDSVIKNIDYNKTEPKPLLIDMICKSYNVNEEWLRTGEGEMFRQKSQEDIIIDAFGKLMAEDDNSFAKQFIAALAQLTPKEWEKVENFARKVSEFAKNTEKKEEE